MVENVLISCLDLIRLGVLPYDFPSIKFEPPTAFNTKVVSEVESDTEHLDFDMLIKDFSDVFDESIITPVKADPMKISINQ